MARHSILSIPLIKGLPSQVLHSMASDNHTLPSINSNNPLINNKVTTNQDNNITDSNILINNKATISSHHTNNSLTNNNNHLIGRNGLLTGTSSPINNNTCIHNNNNSLPFSKDHIIISNHVTHQMPSKCHKKTSHKCLNNINRPQVCVFTIRNTCSLKLESWYFDLKQEN